MKAKDLMRAQGLVVELARLRAVLANTDGTLLKIEVNLWAAQALGVLLGGQSELESCARELIATRIEDIEQELSALGVVDLSS